MIDFSLNHFELFGLPSRYRIDATALEHAYRTLQGNVHPDRLRRRPAMRKSGTRCRHRRV